MKKVMLVAGEQSGDILGAGLIRCLKAAYPDCIFSGIGGERMIAEGLESYYPIDRLSVMGFIEPLKRLPELLGIIKNLKAKFNSERPDVFIGIDSPDFNIRLELAAKALGIYSVHYVSPSVWAWRQGRVKKIKKSVDLMLVLLPFEAEFYQKYDVPVSFVGHPLADEIPFHPDYAQARNELEIPQGDLVIALMPGSRRAEVAQLLPVMLEGARQLIDLFEQISFILPAASQERLVQIKDIFSTSTLEPEKQLENIYLVERDSHLAICAADFVVMASGTTTLEAMLFKRPMVITYKWPRLTWELLKRLVKVPWVGLPNLLLNEEVAPELLQEKATPENIVRELAALIDSDAGARVADSFLQMHKILRRDASQSAANAVNEGWLVHCNEK